MYCSHENKSELIYENLKKVTAKYFVEIDLPFIKEYSDYFSIHVILFKIYFIIYTFFQNPAISPEWLFRPSSYFARPGVFTVIVY